MVLNMVGRGVPRGTVGWKGGVEEVLSGVMNRAATALEYFVGRAIFIKFGGLIFELSIVGVWSCFF